MRKDSKNYGLWQRFGALILAAVLVFGMIPATGTAASTNIGTVNKIEDPETLTRPQAIYGDNTLNAGKVTVGKSVSKDAITVDGVNIPLTGDNNFLVTISQTAQVMGLSSESSIPVDVVFVIDTSGSMAENGRAETLVTATNSAIKTLMETNEQNRVAVVAFSSAAEEWNGKWTDWGGGTAGEAAANVLSSLAHYTGTAATNHLQWVNSEGSASGSERVYIAGRDETTITVGSGRNEQTLNVHAFRHGKNGGTNIQAGIAMGAQILTGVQNTTWTNPDTNETVTRIPFLILVSDGQPTYVSDSTNWYEPTGIGQQGPGSGAYEGNGFISVLTAAYYKGKVTEHYYGDSANVDNHCFVYTMGVEIEVLDDYENNRGQMVSAVGDNQSLAQITLDPATYATGSYAANNAQSYYRYGNTWDEQNANNRKTTDSFMTYWNNYTSGNKFEVKVNENEKFTFTAASITNSKKYVNGIGYTGGLAYNDEYFAADDVEDLEAIFEALIAEISKKAITVPTKVTTGDHDFDGYVTFTDPLGAYMEVKNMKGIIADGYFYQGASAARYLEAYGTANANAEFDALLRKVLKTRMGLSDSDDRFTSDAALDAFINSVVATADGNSLTWWGNEYHTGEEDVQVQVLAPAADDSITYIEAQKAAGTIPADADYVCRSYFFYGEAGGANPNPDHEYLYFVVRVQRSIHAPYQQTVVISAPASLLSVEKVMINETFDRNGNPSYTASVDEAKPARVVYEVGLWDTINEESVSTIVSAEYAGQPVNGAGQVNYDPATDTYYFFTNDWDRSAAQDSHHRPMAKATFDAAADNPFYTYQKDTLLVDASGKAVTSNPAGKTAYYVREYYDWAGSSLSNGTYAATKKTQLIKVDIPSNANLINKDGKWYIPKGAYTAATLIVNGDDVEKSDNATKTSEIVAHPHRTGDSSNSHYTVYLGNNGSISLKSNVPTPTKTVANVTKNITDADGKAVMVDDILEYTIKAKNYGSETGTLTITDTVPAGTAFVDADLNAVPDADGKLTWTIGNVTAGTEVTVSFRVRVTEAALDNAVVVSAIENTATVKLNNGPAYETNTTTNPPEGKKVAGTGSTGPVKVGDVLVYSIEFYNDSASAATITIEDIVPAGTTFLSADHNGVHANGKVTWTINNVQPGMGGVVSFTVQVNAGAVTEIENDAYIQIGTNDPRQTNKTTTDRELGSLTISKVLALGDTANAPFTLTLTESTGTLNGSFAAQHTNVPAGVTTPASIQFVNGVATITIYAGQTITIQDLPAGVEITVVESPAAGWTPTYSSGTVTVPANGTASVTVTNDYYAEPAKFQLRGIKTFSGANFPTGTFTFRAQEYDMTTGTVKDGGIVVTAQATSNGEGSVVFSFSERTFAEEIDRYYLITEDASAIPGVTTSGAQYLLHLVVEDNGAGNLVLTATVSTDGGSTWTALDNDASDNALSISFTNTYEPKETSIVIEGTKALFGRYLDANDFSFQLIYGSDVIATATNGTGTLDNPSVGSFRFPAITYTAEDLDGATEKTFTYYIREVTSSQAPNTEYDDSYYMVEVTVKDVNGQLVATQKLTHYVMENGQYVATANPPQDIRYTNTYTPSDTSVTLTGSKILTGEGVVDGTVYPFSFSVYKSDAAGTQGSLVTVGSANVTGTAAGSITFGSIGISPADMTDSQLVGGVFTKTFYFLVLEDRLESNPNMYYDPARFLASVTVTYDPDSGVLVPGAVTYQEWDGTNWINANGISYENRLNKSSVTVKPQGTKTTGGNNVPADISFSFSVINTANGNEASVGVGSANGSIDFSAMSFSTPGTYTYWIVESNAGNTTNGITYDATRYLMEVVVTRDEYNKLHAAVKYYAAVEGQDGSDDVTHYTVLMDSVPAFENTYAAAGHINITAKKNYNATLNDGDFAFKLIRQDNGGEIDGIVKEDGTIVFATMYYSGADIPDGQTSAVIHYVMSEVIPVNAAIPGVKYDTSEHDVYVQITDNGDGTITAALVTPDGNGGYIPANGTDTGVVFTNTYTVQTGTEVKIEATKTLSGRKLAAGEFGFNLSRYDAMTNTWKNVGTAFNDASGKILFTRNVDASTLSHLATSFADIDNDGHEEYVIYYHLEEVDSNLGGIQYSEAEYFVKVVIQHNESTASYSLESVEYYTEFSAAAPATEGQPYTVTVSSQVEQAAVTFANRYDTNDVRVTPVASKVLLGANGTKLNPAGFSFQVVETNAQGEKIEIDPVNHVYKVVATGTSDADGVVTFSSIPYGSQTGDQTHYYVIEESHGSTPGVTYSTQKYYVKVEITDNGLGVLTVQSVTYYSDAFVTPITDGADEGDQVDGGEILFTNHYGPGYMTLELELDKKFRTETGKSYDYALVGSEFDFVVYSDEACTIPVTTGTNGPSVNGVAPITFGSIVIDAQGTYTYYIKEVSRSGATHIGIDGTVIKVEVTVTDDGYGNLSAVYQYTNAATGAELDTFTNTYQPAPAQVSLEVIKHLEGKDLTNEVFTFVLTDGTDEIGPWTQTEAGKYTISWGYDAFDMSGATYANGVYTKVFTYTLTEAKTVANGSTHGTYVYDETIYTVTVTLTDDGSGQLRASVAVTKPAGTGTETVDTIVFNNVYDPTDVSLDLTEAADATKTIVDDEGNVLYRDDVTFKFLVTDLSGNKVADGTVTGSGEITFTPGLTYSAPGEYRYLITEVAEDKDGYVLDATVWCIHIQVHYDAVSGKLSVSESEVYKHVALGSHSDDGTQTQASEDPAFVNVYDAKDVHLILTMDKKLTGDRTALKENEFRFQLLNSDGTIAAEARNDANGKVRFFLDYNLQDLNGQPSRTFEYTVKEVIPQDAVADGNGGYILNGITYTTKTYTVTVVVRDDGKGNLIADVAGSIVAGTGTVDTDITFTNKYTAADVSVSVYAVKRMEGMPLTDNAYVFYVMDGDTVLTTGSNKADGTIVFDKELTFTEVGTYTYTVVENKGSRPGVTFDETSFTMTVVVTDNGVGNLVAEVIYSTLEGTYDHPVFINIYTPKETYATIGANKDLVNKDLQADDFTFQLLDSQGNVIDEAKNKADGTVTFEAQCYDEVGTHTYTIVEVIPDDAVENGDGTYTMNGVTYDQKVYTVVVEITDTDFDGTLDHKITYYLGTEIVEADDVCFTNTYTTADSNAIVIEGTKVLENKTLEEGKFSFQLKDSTGEVLETVTNGADGKFSFTALKYTFADLGGETSKVFTYTVSEVKGNMGGVTYDETVYNVKVTVTDNGDGTLTAVAVITEGEIVFTNTYSAADSNAIVIEGTKVLENKTLEEGKFSFQLKDSTGEVLETVTNGADGKFSFTALKYTFADLEGQTSKIFVYNVVEVKGDMGGVTYDETVYAVTVTVTDNGDGTVSAEAVITGGDGNLVFTNVYEADDATVDVQAEKELTGKDLTEGEFSFILVNKDNKDEKYTVTNKADGTVTFADLTFTAAGTYVYELSEVAGTDTHYTYDDKVITVTITVTDNGDGTMTATASYSENPVFRNTYTPDPISVELKGEKDLTGRDQKAGEFDFVVKDAQGNLVTTGTNKADGTIDFDPIVIDTEMELVLYVSEVKGTDKQMEYDNYTYRVKVVVTNENGVLKAAVSYLDGDVVFYNEYKVPETPPTGDETPVHFFMGLMGFSAVALMAVLVLGREKKRRKFF